MVYSLIAIGTIFFAFPKFTAHLAVLEVKPLSVKTMYKYKCTCIEESNHLLES